MSHWKDEFFMREAARAASMSPDLSTQNGAILVASDHYALSEGWNTPPEGLALRSERPEKYTYTEHAERMALFDLCRNNPTGLSSEGSTLFAVWAACEECARALIAAGVTRVVTHAHHRANPAPGWDLTVADAMLAEAGVQLDIVDIYLGQTLRFQGLEYDL